mgnify:CR=1 FL=1
MTSRQSAGRRPRLSLFEGLLPIEASRVPSEIIAGLTLAALALIIITLYLKRRGGLKWLIAGLPGIFMAVMTIWAVILNEVKFSAGNNMLLTVINLLVLLIAVWILIEGVIKFFGTEEEPAAPAAPETA